MIWTKNNTQIASLFNSTIDAPLVEIGSEQVHAIRTTQIIGPVAVEIANAWTVCLVDDGSDLKVILNILPVLKRNTMRIYKGKVGHAGLKLQAHREAFRETLLEQ